MRNYFGLIRRFGSAAATGFVQRIAEAIFQFVRDIKHPLHLPLHWRLAARAGFKSGFKSIQVFFRSEPSVIIGFLAAIFLLKPLRLARFRSAALLWDIAAPD